MNCLDQLYYINNAWHFLMKMEGAALKYSVLQLSLALLGGPPMLELGARGDGHHLEYRMDTIPREEVDGIMISGGYVI